MYVCKEGGGSGFCCNGDGCNGGNRGCRCGGKRGVCGGVIGGGMFFGAACASASISFIALSNISLRPGSLTGFGFGSRGGCRCGTA